MSLEEDTAEVELKPLDGLGYLLADTEGFIRVIWEEHSWVKSVVIFLHWMRGCLRSKGRYWVMLGVGGPSVGGGPNKGLHCL